MQRHWRFLVALSGLILLGFVAGLAVGSLTLSIVSVLVGLVAIFVMATAFLRPEGQGPEHHAAADRLFDDTDP